MGKPGRPRKEDGGRRTTWMVRPADLLDRLQDQARREGTDVSALLSRLATAYLKRKRGRR